MLDWAKITSDIEYAMTLDGSDLTSFIESLPETRESDEIARLLERIKPRTDFLATSASEGANESELLEVGTRLDAWRIDELIGIGGMGFVYQASRADGLYQQTVALKIIQGLSLSRATMFENERQRLASLNHKGIAGIIDGGSTHDGRPYMVMEFIDGVPINQYALNANSTQKHKLELFKQVCEAVEYAHANLILHKDIKSDNVLVAKDGSPRLIDFGIASSIENTEGVSNALSLATASPEQLKGEPISVQTDVFGLGVLLYEMLTAKRPIRQSNGGMEVSSQDKELLSHDLTSIICKALAFDPKQRYASATAMSEDISAYIDKRPVTARKGNWRYKANKFLQRYPLSSALATTAFLALTIGLSSSLKFANDATAQATRAELALEKANWQFGRIEATLAAQQAYSDVLMRAFGGEEDVERLSKLLMQRWEQAFAEKESDSKTAAALSYAIGRNFYFRGDTAAALSIFDPWMKEKFGPEQLVSLGEEVYAMMLSDAGRFEESIEIFRRLVSFFGDGSQTSEADASNYANRLARATRAPDDIARSVKLLERRLESLDDPFERLFSYSQLAGMRTLEKNFEDATYAYGQTVRIMEENPAYAIYGRDIARFNYASITLAWKQDLRKAKELITSIFEEDVPLKGESIQKARAHMLNALIYSLEQKHDKAIEHMQESLALFERFGGINSDILLVAKGVYAYIRQQSAHTDDAKFILNQAQNAAVTNGANQRTLDSLKLIDIYLRSTTEEASKEELEWLQQDTLHTDVSANLVIFFFYRQLEMKGLAPAFWQT